MSSSKESTFRWGDYLPSAAALGSRTPVDTLKQGWRALPREIALSRYDSLMAVRSERVQYVVDLATANGYAAGLDTDGIREVNRFFLRNLPIDKSDRAGDGTELVDDQWMSVVWDLALLVGEVSIARNPNLEWEFFEPGRVNTLGAYTPSLVGHREGDVTLPFLHLEGYVNQICDRGKPKVVRAKGVDVPLFASPVKIDKLLQLIEIEDRLA